MARIKDDYYPTPLPTARAFLDAVALPGGRWLEPSAGAGALVRAVGRADVTWDLVEVRPEACAELARLEACVASLDCPTNYLTRPPPARRYEVALANPPFSKAGKFVAKMLEEAENVVALLPLAFMASQGRVEFHLRNPSEVYVLGERPSFTGDGHGDMRDVAWFFWREHRTRPSADDSRPRGAWTVLPPAGAGQQAALPLAAGREP
jgi:hypothetical protein